MNHHPVISIVTIFRDPPVPFFEEAIASVFAQTESRWELLLVDDGSTNPCAAMADSFARDNPHRVSVLRHPGGVNRGMSASRNLGISAAQGEFVSFLDADDLYLPEKLERQLADISRHAEVAMVYGPSLYWWGWTGDSKDLARDHPRRLGLRPNGVVAAPVLARAWLADRGDTPATCAVLIRRQAIEAVVDSKPTSPISTRIRSSSISSHSRTPLISRVRHGTDTGATQRPCVRCASERGRTRTTLDRHLRESGS